MNMDDLEQVYNELIMEHSMNIKMLMLEIIYYYEIQSQREKHLID